MNETTQLPDLFYDPNRSKRPQLQTREPLPMTPEEVSARGWENVDVVFITGDAYVDSPSFANGLLARVLEKDGFKVAILSQPTWDSADVFRKFGRPRLAFCISAGNMDSMINHYTANRKVRNDDAYSPGGKIGLRPDRATLVYCQRAREAFSGVPIVAGGIEASLRRIAHYDYWSDKVRRSIVFDAKIDLLVYGMGERATLEIMRRLDAGQTIKEIRNVRGTVYKLGKTEDLPEESAFVVHLPSYDPELTKQAEEARNARLLFVEMTRIAYKNLNPYCAKSLVQEHGDEAIVVNPPAYPLSEKDMNDVYSLPFTRKAHPSYKETIPAVEVVRSSVQTHRGCFGGCSFCAITAHQGKFIQPRSEDAILGEIKQLAKESGGNYVVGDLNAPTANMYRLKGNNQEVCSRCERTSCLCPEICPNLNVDHSAYVNLLRKARNLDGVKSVLIASGIRTDLAKYSPEFIEELAAYHTGGHLKTAPEHVNDNVLRLMNKPPIADYEQFCEQFAKASRKLGKEQYLVPYLIAGFPGCTLEDMVGVAEYLKKNNIRPEQVQDFIPAPFQLATCAYYTGVDPISGKEIYVPKGLRERRLQHSLLLYYNPTFYHDVKSALKEARREDLIGNDNDDLIPPYPPKGDALRRSSRVKRYIRQNEKEAREKEDFRGRFIESEPEEKQAYGKRAGRERSLSNGGYRSGAREFGVRSRYVDSKIWDPIDKKWKRAKKTDILRDQDTSKESFRSDKQAFGRSENGGCKRPGDLRFKGEKHQNGHANERIKYRSFRDKNGFRGGDEAECEFFQKGSSGNRGGNKDRLDGYSSFHKPGENERQGARSGLCASHQKNRFNTTGNSSNKNMTFDENGRSTRKGSPRSRGKDESGGFKRRPT